MPLSRAALIGAVVLAVMGASTTPASASQSTAAASALTASAACPHRTVCVWTGVGFTGDRKKIPVEWLYDCRNVEVNRPMQSIYNNTRFRFELHAWWNDTWNHVGTAAGFKGYKRVGGGPLTWFRNIKSPGCPI